VGDGGAVDLELVRTVRRNDGSFEPGPARVPVGAKLELAVEGQRKLVCVVLVPLGPALPLADPQAAGLPEVDASRRGNAAHRLAPVRGDGWRSVEVRGRHQRNAASQPFFWDGRKDSLWSQALGPLEDVVEHGSNRTRIAKLLLSHYRPEYEALFGPAPDLSGFADDAGPQGNAAERTAWQTMTSSQRGDVNRVFANLGKAIAAYERTLKPGESRFDRYARAVVAADPVGQQALSSQELAHDGSGHHNERKRIRLSESEIRDLAAFLRTLSSGSPSAAMAAPSAF
jgi:hypothetical protein